MKGSPKAKIELTALKSQCNLGEQVKGTIKFCSDEEFDVKQLIVQLSCMETVKQNEIGIRVGLIPIQNVSSFNNVEIYRDCRVLFGAGRVRMSFSATYPYALNISAGAKETLYSAEHSVRWQLFAISRIIESS